MLLQHTLEDGVQYIKFNWTSETEDEAQWESTCQIYAKDLVFALKFAVRLGLPLEQ